ncbi:hypothetical protein F5141DRAFT_1294809 [Pisolithus sp. B1]|nr:hypothetical protein F5141DRAFT_1294809 [Pisolithus sp. B1]
MVNYTIVSGIPDTIFGFMLHLKSPLEKWDYLEKRFGSIPRPESWLVAEEAKQRSNSNIARGAGQEAHDSNNELQNSPSSHEDPVDSPSDCTETEAGQAKPEPKVVDAQHLKPYLLGVEVEAIGSKQPAEGMDALEAPDSSSQCAGDKVEEEDLPTTSSKALKTQQDLPDAMSECAETRTGHTKPEDEVVDTRHVVDVLPMFEVGSTGQAWYSKHVKDLQVSDKGGWRASDEVERSRDLPKSSSEVRKPMSIEDSQHTWMNSETITNIPDPPGAPMKLSTPQVKSSLPHNRPSAQACSATTTEFDLLRTRRSSKQRETRRLELDCKQALGRPKRTYQGHSTSETPPDDAWGMGVHRPTRAGKGDSMDVELKTTKLEIRGLSARTVEMQAHLPHWDMTRKEPDKVGDTGGRGDDTASKDFVDLRGVEKMLLAISRSQQGEREAKWQNGLPVPPETPPNGCTHPPETYRVLRPCGRLKSKAESISSDQTRRNTYCVQAAPKWPLPLLLVPSNRSLDPARGSWTMNIHYNEVRHVRQVETRGRTYRIAGIPMRLLQLLTNSSKRFIHPVGGLWMTKVCYNEMRRARQVEARGGTYRTACILMQLLLFLSNPSKRHQTISNTYWRKGVPPGSTRNDAKWPRNLHTAKRLPCSSGRRQDDRRTSIYSPAPSKRPPNDLTCAPSTLRNLRRRATIKTRSKNISTIETRGSKASGLTIPIPPPRELARPLWNVANTYWQHGIPLDERETSKLYCYSIQRPSGNGTRQDDARTRRAFRKRKLPQRNDASTQPHVHSLHTRTRSSLAAEYTLVY